MLPTGYNGPDGRVRVGLTLIDVGLCSPLLSRGSVRLLVHAWPSLLSELGVGVSVGWSATARVSGRAVGWDGVCHPVYVCWDPAGLEKRSKEKEQNYCCVARRRRKKKKKNWKKHCTKYHKLKKKRG